MRNRLTAFAVALLLLPPLGITLAGQELDSASALAGDLWLPALFAAGAVLAFGFLLDLLTFRRTGHSLLRSQRSYLLWNGAAGAATGMLLAYLNLFAGTWFTPAGSDTQALLLAALCGTALLPAILVARLWLAGLPGLVKLSTRKFALPEPPAETAALLLVLAALTGLIAGPIWIDRLGWLLWLSPLLLLAALQLLWHESTVFSGLAQGDWSRLLFGAISGIAVGGFALAAYRLGGGTIHLDANTWQLIAGLSIFGLLCLQIGDIVAEHWRGKQRGEVFKKKPFPVSVVSKKDQ
ncbi:MAG: hypothetical protein HZB47_05565 [Nitrosomonadales bacterium]|nr:hypothetical protein [Nitrosomonadales bacterium]